MSPVAVLLSLLLFAYVGSVLVSGRTIRGYGLPSGLEYLLLGWLLGPHALALLTREALSEYEPLAAVALGWLALVVGVDFGYVEDRKISVRGASAGLLLAALSSVITALVTYRVAGHFTTFSGTDLLVLSAGIGIVSCETTRHAARWLMLRYDAKGPLAELAADISDADELVPLLLLSAVFGMALPHTVRFELSYLSWSLVTLGLGVVLGLACAALLRAEASVTSAWGVLLGAALLAIGATWRLGLSAMATTFAMGLAVVLLSRHRQELRSMLAGTERAVLLPTLLFAGASVNLAQLNQVWVVVVVALGLRVLLRVLAGPILARLAGARLGTGMLFGVGLLPSGAVTIAMGLAFSLRFPGSVGDSVLICAALVTLLGELFGTAALRRALERSGALQT